MSIRHAVVSAPQIPERIGQVTVVADGDDVIGVYYRGHWTRPDRSTFGPEVSPTDPVIAEAATQLGDYLEGRRTSLDFATRAEGSKFEQRVWAILRAIPCGETITYGRIAEQLGDRSLARMVGRAVGQNPLSIAVPCHRVVGSDGSLTGYAGGLERKRFLLELEGALKDAAPTLF
ncbi:methylated-DNA--[protein]-cysteine S-methyltransferase [Humibacter sp.]|uniref:methylated-DNA--[protein]-cysteine S-methyltransferase n=1 Tax=Humibacter sp. TaxID=1940291 RepID=UPI002BCBEDE8|nr:methylated-DNA--[protein]-cysteine S-methyltransferase [Humibacter sp.]HVX08969.1 methylated-DNA--[protein]-cysteine S-methyltransferase [Humibacter sp.]